MPLGVVGSYLLGKAEKVPDHLSFKHHYLAGAFDSEVLYDLLSCRRQQKKAEIHFFTRRSKETHPALVYPLKVYISTQSGRENLVAYNYELKRPRVYRLDRIRRVKMMEPEQEPEKLDQYGRKFAEKLWGVSAGPDGKREADHLEMVIRVEEGEKFILGQLVDVRLERVVDQSAAVEDFRTFFDLEQLAGGKAGAEEPLRGAVTKMEKVPGPVPDKAVAPLRAAVTADGLLALKQQPVPAQRRRGA